MKIGRLFLACLAILSALAACSGPAVEASTTKQISERTIRNELAAELGLGELAARCPEVAEPTVNANFLCMATTADGQTVNVEATVKADGRIEAKTTNVIRAAALAGFERRAVADINGAAGSELLETDLDCGGSAAVLNPSKEMTCAVNSNGAVYDVTLTVKDIEETRFDLEVAKSPRA